MSLFERYDRHAGLVSDMADTLGVDLAEMTMTGRLTPSDHRAAVFRCIGCTQPGACAEWTAAHTEGARHAPDYCRNKEQLERLAPSA